MAKNKENHYVNNEKFLEAIIDYKKLLLTEPDAQVPEYIGICILDIATRFARKPNFSGYTYKDEMVSDAVENCFQYLTNFDPEKSSNPFAYYTQVAYYAFLRRIMSEKKQSYIKHQMVQEMPVEAFSHQEGDDSDMMEHHINSLQTNSTFDGKAFEDVINKRKQKAEKKKRKKTPLEKIMED